MLQEDIEPLAEVLRDYGTACACRRIHEFPSIFARLERVLGITLSYDDRQEMLLPVCK